MKPLRRNYRLSDASLIQLADDIHGSATRDLTALADHGVTSLILTSLVTARDAFSNYPTDEELMGDLIVATENRNTMLETAKRIIDNISSKARFKFGEQSGKYRKFGIEALSQQKPQDLLRMGRRVWRIGTEMLVDLDSEGLSQTMLDDLSGNLFDLDNLIDAQRDAIKERDVATHERTTLGNVLYAKMALLAEKGKLCWKYSNEALYNDYVITERSTPDAQVVDGNVSAGQAVNLSVADVESTTEFILKNTGNSMLHFFFTNDPVSTTEAAQVPLASGATLTITASQLGYNEGSGFVLFNVYNAGVAVGSYDVEWS